MHTSPFSTSGSRVSTKFHGLRDMAFVERLLSPKSSAKAAMTLKNRNWSQLEYAQLLDQIREQRQRRKPLAAPARQVLYNGLPAITHPAVRQLFLDVVDSEDCSSTEGRSALIQSYLRSGDVEMAASLADASVEHSIQLIELGGAAELYKLLAHEGKELNSELWGRLFESLVRADHYPEAKNMWLHTPYSGPQLPVGEPVLLSFIELIGRYADKPMLKSFLSRTAAYGDALPLTAGTVSACLNCFSGDDNLANIVMELEPVVQRYATLQDMRQASDALARRTVDILSAPSQEQQKQQSQPPQRQPFLQIPQLLGDLLLQGLYRQNQSQTVFHAYRYLERDRGFAPRESTAQILANSAFRLGNSQLVGYALWREMVVQRGLHMGRRFYETMLMCQMVGKSYKSALFFVAEMRRRHIPLRSHIQRMLLNKFDRTGESSLLIELLSQRRPEKLYLDFDPSFVEAAHTTQFHEQAKANAQLFIYGKSPDEDPLTVLEKMLQYDERKAVSRENT